MDACKDVCEGELEEEVLNHNFTFAHFVLGRGIHFVLQFKEMCTQNLRM